MNDINKITLIGTGLIGASLGLAIKKFIPNIEIIGFDLDKKNLAYSKNIRAIDQTALSIEDSVMDSGLVILSVPIREMKDIFLKIKVYFVVFVFVEPLEALELFQTDISR